MSIQETTNNSSIQEGSRINIRCINASPEFKRFVKTKIVYKDCYKTPSNDELKALPTGVLLKQTGVSRSISGAGSLEHVQLIYYYQPLLGNTTTNYFLRTVIDNEEGKYSKDVQEYVETNSTQMYMDFPFAFQMAYDIYTTGTITDKTRERKRVIETNCRICRAIPTWYDWY